MKLLQLNVWGGRLDRQIGKLLEDEQPDIACLQESISYPRQTGGFMLSVEDMQKLLPGADAFVSPELSFPLFNDVANFGNTILSKPPIKKQETIFTNLAFKANFDNDLDDYNIRNLQHAAIDVDGQTLHVLNHHGHHVPNHKNGTPDTLRQCRMIADYIDTLDGPIILTGDFNLAPHSESLELLNSRLNNLSIQHHLKTTRTNLTHKTEVCDYIFVSSAVTVKNFHASDEVVSDHKALILEFEL